MIHCGTSCRAEPTAALPHNTSTKAANNGDEMGDIPVPLSIDGALWSQPSSLSWPGGSAAACSPRQPLSAMTQRDDGPEASSSSKAPIKAARKTKRTQYTSCDACRLRKVKCIKEPGETECNGCRTKNISCSHLFSERNAFGNGKRISQARDQFGTAVEILSTSQSSSSESPANISNSSSASPGHSLGSTTVVAHAAMRRINERVLSAKALCAFLHAYQTDVIPSLPAIDYDRLFNACNKVNFDINRLDDMDKLLCLAVAGVAANVQQGDRHFGVGQSAITISDPIAVKRDFETQALPEADRLGLLRKPSSQSLDILRLLCILTSGDEAHKWQRSDSYRAYEQALVEHMRTLAERGDISEERSAHIFWSTILGDSLAAAISGRSPSYSSEDIEVFASFVDYSTEGSLRLIAELDLSSVEGGFGLLFASLCQLCRTFYTRVTSVRARKRPFIDIKMMEEIPEELDRLSALLDVNDARLDVLFQGGPWQPKLEYWSKIMRFIFTFVIVIALDELEAALLRELSGNASEQRVRILQQAYQQLQFRAMHELKAHVGWVNKAGPSRIMATADGLVAYFSVLRMRRLLKLPTLEEGGNLGCWSMLEKLQAAQYYMTVCEYLGTAVPVIADELPGLRTDIESLHRRAAAMLASFTAGETVIPLDASGMSSEPVVENLYSFDGSNGKIETNTPGDLLGIDKMSSLWESQYSEVHDLYKPVEGAFSTSNFVSGSLDFEAILQDLGDLG